MKNYRIIKGRKISLKEIAAKDRKFTVNNIPKTKPTFDKKNLSEVKFGENDVHFVQKVEGWKNTKNPQPKCLHKKQTNFPNYTIKPLTKEAYWEKLVEHKLKKWEKKNPKPNQNLFERVEEWEQKRFIAEQQFRDFVISIYDRLKVTASLIPPLPSKEILLAKIKDCGDSKNVEVARKIAKQAMKNDKRILHCQLLDHKEKSYRLVA